MLVNADPDPKYFLTVLRIQIWNRRIHMFWGFLDLDPDPLVRGMDPDLGSFYHQEKIVRKTLIHVL